MDYIGFTSIVLFDQLCADLGLTPEPTGSRFDPFPSGTPTESELSTRDFAKYALLRSLFKKSEVEASSEAEADTLREFLIANEACWNFSSETLSQFDGDPIIGYALSGAKVILERAFFPDGDAILSMGSIESAARFGPGRSVGLGSKPSLLYFKVGDSQQTAGSDFVRSWYEVSTSYNAVCEAAEMARKARHGRARVVEHGNLSFVPKSYSRKRIVVTEPSLNTYFQLGVGAVMERVLSYTFNIDFATQPSKNAELARLGSMTGEYATMDLKQCSDYISLGLVEFLFPPSVVRWLKKLRTSRVRRTIPPIKGGEPTFEFYELGMCGTMGNGFTFPLQTLLLSSLVSSTLDVLGIEGEWGVFGDDIVVPSVAFNAVRNVLQTCGLKVNEEKSFASGSFRESCGSDWFRGTNVRGVYLKDYTSPQDIASAFNRLALWGAVHDIDVSGTLCLLLQIVDGVIPIVPPDEPVTAGIRTPMPVVNPDEGGLWTYFPWRVKPSVFNTEPWLLYEVGAELRGKRKKKFHDWVNALSRSIGTKTLNEPALLKVLLAGGIRRYKMFVREDNRAQYRQIRAVTPRWGFSSEAGFPREEEVDKFLGLQLLIEKAFHLLLERVTCEN